MTKMLGTRSKIGLAAVLLLTLAVAMPATAARRRGLTLKKVQAFADARYALKDHTHPETMQTVLSSDGAGSGLDADLLDGRNSSEFDDDAKGKSEDPAGGDPRPPSTFSEMIDLSSGTSNRLVLSHPSLIMGTASLNFYTGSATASEVQCQMTVTPDGGSPAVISQTAQAKFPASSAFDVQVHVTGSSFRQPGTYDVDVQCRESAGDIRYARGDLIAWAI